MHFASPVLSLYEITGAFAGAVEFKGYYAQKNHRMNTALQYLKSLGLPCKIDPDPGAENIIVDLPCRNDGRYLIVSAHYDSAEDNPGANDNALGVGAAIRIAHSFYRKPAANLGIKVILFDLEEFDCIGSWKYVKSHPNDSIAGVINLDMIGSGNYSYMLWGYGEDTKNRDLLTRLKGYCLKRDIQTLPIMRIGSASSDHYPFSCNRVEAFTISALDKADHDALQSIALDELFRGFVPIPDWHRISSSSIAYSVNHKREDTPDKVDYSSAERLCSIVEGLLRELDTSSSFV